MRHAGLSFRTILCLAVAGLVTVAGVRASSSPSIQSSQSAPSSAGRLAVMQHHYTQVMRVHEAVIRGDLPGVRQPARELADSAMPPGIAAGAAPSVAAIRRAGQRAAEAITLASAASATVSMINECANCHRTVGVYPVPSTTPTHDVGGLVGHMLEHQRAADEMLQGLLIPSASQWRQGAERLQVAALRPGQFPPDRKLTDQIRKAEGRVHQLAEEAAKADTPNARAASYVQILTSCAECHSLHKVWGPKREE